MIIYLWLCLILIKYLDHIIFSCDFFVNTADILHHVVLGDVYHLRRVHSFLFLGFFKFLAQDAFGLGWKPERFQFFRNARVGWNDRVASSSSVGIWLLSMYRLPLWVFTGLTFIVICFIKDHAIIQRISWLLSLKNIARTVHRSSQLFKSRSWAW